MRFFTVLSLAGVAEAIRLTTSNNAMRKVIQLLSEMKNKVEQETAQGKKDAEDYADWCIKSITETEADVKYGSQKVEELTAQAEDGVARAAAARADAAECGMAIGKTEKAQDGATSTRREQAKTFVSKESELVEADTMLGKAYSVLKRSLSLMQSGANPQATYTQEVVAALGQIIESAYVDPSQTQRISAFLEDTDSLSLTAPQANTKNYVSKSGAILETIQTMQEKNAEILGKLRQAEMSARHEHELLMQDLKNTENNKSEQMAAAKEVAAKSEAAGKEAESGAAESADVLDADKKELSETKTGCDKAAKQWSAREAEAANEVAVIAQAVEILSGKFGSSDESKGAFLQLSADALGEEETRFAKRQAASELLRKLGREYNQFALIQAAQSVQDDPFAKVRTLIGNMITRLEEEQRKESSKEAKCQIDKEKGHKDLKAKTVYYQKLASRENASNAKIVKLGNEINDLAGQLKELAQNVQALTSFRNKEKVDNASVVKDAQESVEAISGAIQTLSEYYGAEGASFIQLSQPKTDSASIIIEMLQTAQEDFEKMKQETEAAENSQSDKYDKEMHDAEVAKTKKTALMEGKTNERSSVKVQLAQISEDLADADKALQAASDFLRGVTESCANKAMSFQERQQRRDAEIQGLREALDILSSDESFVQTTGGSGFLARSN